MAPLRDGTRALVSDDLDDATVWANAREYACARIVMVPDGIPFLVRHLNTRMIAAVGGIGALPRPQCRS